MITTTPHKRIKEHIVECEKEIEAVGNQMASLRKRKKELKHELKSYQIVLGDWQKRNEL